MDLTEKKISSEEIFNGKVIRVCVDKIELPDGKEGIRELVHHRGAVCVVPITDEGEVICVRQYRYAIGQVTLEIPAGKLDSPDEDPRAAALRELREETGIVAAPEEFSLLCSDRDKVCFYDFYCLKRQVPIREIVLLPGETDAVQWADMEKIHQMIKNGEICRIIGHQFRRQEGMLRTRQNAQD